jgi:hypothetical protein
MQEETTRPLRAKGSCLCGAVQYEVRGPMRPVLECYCRTCRRFSGGIWNATAARRPDVTIRDAGTLRWYRSSPPVRRGFCGACGSSLFLDRDGRDYLVLTAGTLDEPTGLKLAMRIFTAEAPDYYDCSPDVPRIADMQHGVEIPER